MLRAGNGPADSVEWERRTGLCGGEKDFECSTFVQPYTSMISKYRPFCCNQRLIATSSLLLVDQSLNVTKFTYVSEQLQSAILISFLDACREAVTNGTPVSQTAAAEEFPVDGNHESWANFDNAFEIPIGGLNRLEIPEDIDALGLYKPLGWSSHA